MNVTPLFIQNKLVAKNKVYRIDDKMRYYYTFVNDQIQIYPSVTSILSGIMPTSEYLIKWYADYGFQKAKQMMNEKALYGTLMHICFSELLTKSYFDLSTIQARIATFAAANNIDFDTHNWQYSLKDDLLALYQFIKDYEIEPIAIEVPLVSHTHKIAGTIDLVVRMKVGTGVGGKVLKNDVKIDAYGTIVEDKRKDIVVLLDWKSGRHGFYATNAAQIHFYKLLWEDNFPEIAIDKVYNWAPKDWTETPTYLFTDQTDSIEKYKIKHYYAIFMIEQEDKGKRKHHTIEGVIDLRDSHYLTFIVEDLETKLNRIFGNKETEEKKDVIRTKNGKTQIPTPKNLLSEISNIIQ
jgi:hypothetical protein